MPESSHGTEFKLRADANPGLRIINQFVLSAGSKTKSMTSNLSILTECKCSYYHFENCLFLIASIPFRISTFLSIIVRPFKFTLNLYSPNTASLVESRTCKNL